MPDTPLDRSNMPPSDEEVIIDQELHHPDGSVHRHREAVRHNDLPVDRRLERERLEADRLAMDRQLQVRDNDNAARGLLVGVIVTTLLGLGLLSWFLLTNRDETETSPVVVPAQPSEPATPSSPPDINITLPDPPAATESTTETAPTQPTIQTEPAPVPPQPPSSAQPNGATTPAGTQAPDSSAPAATTDPAAPVPESPAPSNGSTEVPATP